jgi:hypothetical protein
VVQVELARTSILPSSPDPIAAAKEDALIPEDEQKILLERFHQLEDKTKGANILWVDDNQPFANAMERRVLSAAGIHIDQAKTTTDAFKWLAAAKYDAIITDLWRDSTRTSTHETEDNPVSPCYRGSDEFANAGCDLLRRVGHCYSARDATLSSLSLDREPHFSEPSYRDTGRPFTCEGIIIRPGERMPPMIVYAANIRSSAAPEYTMGITNRADRLFHFVLNALQERKIKDKNVSAAK